MRLTGEGSSSDPKAETAFVESDLGHCADGTQRGRPAEGVQNCPCFHCCAPSSAGAAQKDHGLRFQAKADLEGINSWRLSVNCTPCS